MPPLYGFLARTVAGLLRPRILQAGSGIAITNPSGDAGDPVISALGGGGSAGMMIPVDDNHNDDFILSVPGLINVPVQYKCVAYNSTTQALTTSTFTAIALNSEDIDIGGMHDNVTNNSRITIPAGGEGDYLFLGYMQYATDGAGAGQRQVDLKLNGTTFISQVLLLPSAGFNVAGIVPMMRHFVPGDYVELFGYQDCGVNLNVGSASRFAACSLSCVKF